jgi:hypothetical protein
MRSVERLLMSSSMAALMLTGTALAQPPDPGQGPPGQFVRRARIGVDDIVERIMSFDKNGDGKVTKEELPERMRFLIGLGDTNKDGALDRDEIKKLAARMATAPREFGGVPAITVERRQIRFADGPVRVPGGFDSGGPVSGPGAVEGVVDDLKLSGKKKDQAMAAVKAHQESVRKLMDQARAELLRKMKEILSAEEFEDFEAALDRPRGGIIFVAPTDPPDGRR